jgi:hypothetical protein
MRCPVCRAENDRGPSCRRCRADLTLLFELNARRRRAVEWARAELGRGRPEQALALIKEAEALRRGNDIRQLRAVACLLRRDFEGAWQGYQASRERGDD